MAIRAEQHRDCPRSEDALIERRFYFRDGKFRRVLERSATAENAEDLAKLIKKEENREVDERSERAKRLAKTAEGLLIVNRGAMADDFLESVWR